MIRLASEASPVELAWAAYDAKMLELHAAYADLTEIGEGQALVTRRGRMLLAIEAEQLHAEFRRLFHTEVDGDNPRPAA